MSGQKTADFRGASAGIRGSTIGAIGRGRGTDRAIRGSSMPRATPTRLAMSRTRAVPLDEALELARKTLREPSNDAIQKFFYDRGFFVKIAHPLPVVVAPRADVASDDDDASDDDASDDEDDAPEVVERARGIDGMFALVDGLTMTSGIVIDARDNFRVLLHPPPAMLHDDCTLARVFDNIDDYNVYDAVDGTSVTLYYVPRLKEWLYATARSYDARGYRWMGRKTFGEAIAECAPCLARDDAMLDKSATYTFIFRHPDFHLLTRDPMSIWQLSGPELAGIPQFHSRIVIDPREGELRFRATDSFNDFVKSGSRALNYGYVFERKSDARAAGASAGPAKAYLESTLHAFIRQHIYDIPKETEGITYKNRALFMHLRAYMSLGMPGAAGISRTAHLMMFPQAADIFSRMDFIIGVLTDLTTMEMRMSKKVGAGTASSASDGAPSAIAARRAETRDVMGREKFGATWDNISERLSVIAKCVGDKLLASGAINAFGDHVHSNIRDRYLSGENLKVFVDLIYDATKSA